MLFIYFSSVILMLRVFKGDKLDYYLMTLFILPVVLLSWIALISRKLASAIGVILFALILIHLNRLPPYNYYHDLQEMVSFIDENTNTDQLQFIFHDLSLTNYFYYGMDKFSEKQMAATSTNLIDVCPVYDGNCTWDGLLICKANSLAEEQLLFYALEPKIDNDYLPITSQSFDNKFVISISQVNSPKLLGPHPQLHDVAKYGSDFLTNF